MIKHHVLRHLNFVNNLYDKIADEETRGKQVVNIKEALMVTPLINSIAQWQTGYRWEKKHIYFIDLNQVRPYLIKS